MKEWGFRQTQTHVWVKTKKIPLLKLVRELVLEFKQLGADSVKAAFDSLVKEKLLEFDLGRVLAFGMGRLFRQTHEIALVGVRGKVYQHLENKSQRSVHFHPTTKHSTKPDTLQHMLEKMQLLK